MSTLIAWSVAAILLVIGSLAGTYLLRKRDKKPPSWHASRFDYAAVPRSNSGNRRDAQDSRSMTRTVWPDVESVLPSLEEFESRPRRRAANVDLELPDAPFTVTPRPRTVAPGGTTAGPVTAAPRPSGTIVTVTVSGSPATTAAPAPSIGRVLPLQAAGESEWAAAEPVELSSLHLATVAAVLAASLASATAGGSMAAETRLLLLRFPRGAALRIVRADQPYMNSLAAGQTEVAEPAPAGWLDAKGATAVASTLLAVLSCERHLEPVREQIHELRAALAGLAARSDKRPAEFLKTSAQELARFVREAHDNPAWSIASPTLRGRVGDACARGLQVWREIHVEIDAVRQHLERLSAMAYFSDGQLGEASEHLSDLLARRNEIDVLACLLAGLHRLRLGFGDGPAPGTFDPLQSVAAALDAGRDRDALVVRRLRAKEEGARNDFYVGKAEFDAARADLRERLDAFKLDAPSTGMERIAAAVLATAEGFPAASGADERWLFRCDKGGRATAVRRLPRSPAG